MNLTNYYWYFKSAVPHRICDDIVKYGHQMQEQMAVTGGYGDKKLNQKQIKDLKKKRDSNIVWMNDRWIYKEIQPYVHEANRNAGWNFQWNYSEACQFTKYKKGQYYDWHADSWNTPYNMEDTNNPKHGKTVLEMQSAGVSFGSFAGNYEVNYIRWIVHWTKGQ